MPDAGWSRELFLSTRLYDVAVGCAIALAGTLLVRAVARPAAAA